MLPCVFLSVELTDLVYRVLPSFFLSGNGFQVLPGRLLLDERDGLRHFPRLQRKRRHRPPVRGRAIVGIVGFFLN